MIFYEDDGYDRPLIPAPPVTVVAVPQKYGSRGFGCKIDNRTLLLPHNKSVELAFADIAPLKTMTVVRSRFNALPVYDGP